MKPTYAVLSWRGAEGRRRADQLREALRRSLPIDLPAGGANLIACAPGHGITAGHLSLLGWNTDPSALQRFASERPAAAAAGLVGATWGAYVLAITGAQEVHMMADPSGAGQGFVVSDSSLAVVTDALTPQLARCASFAPVPDAAALARCLLFPPSLMDTPLLSSVRPLRPGVLEELWSGQTTEIWTPEGVATTDLSPELILRDAVDGAVEQLRGRKPLVLVSGGLDSAIVAASAARAGLELGCLHVDGGLDVSEAGYAQEICDKLEVPLAIASSAGLPDYSRFIEVPQHARPFLHGLDDVFEREMACAVLRSGADRIMTGQGGDACFLKTESLLTAADRRRDLGPLALSASVDDATRCKTTVWRAMAEALIPKRPGPLRALAPHLIAAELRRAMPPQHGWVERQPPRSARRLHVGMIANSLTFHTARPAEPPVPIVHPLLSQPVIEAVLAIPTWQLASGPVDRGLARRAFSDRLPATVIARSGKGAASAFFSRAAVRNLPKLTELLLEGQLARAGVIDRIAMEAALTARHLLHSTDYRALMLHASCEAWLSAWTERAPNEPEALRGAD